VQESAAAAAGGYGHQPLGMPPRPPSQPVPPLRPTALVTPGHFTLLPPSAQYVCQPPVPMPATPYRLVGAHGQELSMSGLTYQLMAPHLQAAHPTSGGATTVQLVPATPVADVYPSSQYLQPPDSSAAEVEPVLHLGVDPKSGAPIYGPPVDPASYQVVCVVVTV